MSAIIQQFTSDDKMILIPNDIYAPITENRRTSMSIFSIDESFQKFELKICELNKSAKPARKILSSKYISSKKNLCTKKEIIKKLVETQSTVLNSISANSNN